MMTLTSSAAGSGMGHLETITLSPSGMARTRVTQRFDAQGALVAMFILQEERIIDAVSGALMKPPPTASGSAGDSA